MFFRLIWTVSFTFLLFVSPPNAGKSENNSRRIITEGDYKYEFYITSQVISTYHLYRRYYWFKSGKINFSDGGSTGALLHGQYTKSYQGTHLLEQGEFVFGLKNSQWKEWYDNGQLKEITNWKNGLMDGNFLQYSQEGNINTKGTFNMGRKNGMWIDFIEGDTLYYKKGKQVDSPTERKIKREKARKEKGKLSERIGKFFRKIFPKKKENGNDKSSKRKDKDNSSKPKRTKKANKVE